MTGSASLSPNEVGSSRRYDALVRSSIMDTPDIARLRIQFRAQLAYGQKLVEHAENMLRLLDILTVDANYDQKYDQTANGEPVKRSPF
jgi:hypothetical protein